MLILRGFFSCCFIVCHYLEFFYIDNCEQNSLFLLSNLLPFIPFSFLPAITCTTPQLFIEHAPSMMKNRLQCILFLNQKIFLKKKCYYSNLIFCDIDLLLIQLTGKVYTSSIYEVNLREKEFSVLIYNPRIGHILT